LIKPLDTCVNERPSEELFKECVLSLVEYKLYIIDTVFVVGLCQRKSSPCERSILTEGAYQIDLNK